VGRVAAAEAMLVFAEALGPNDGAALTLAAVALLEAAGEADAATAALAAAPVAEADPDLQNRIETHFAGYGLLDPSSS
jgi:hypothetical protein